MSAPCPLVVMKEAASLLVGCPDPEEADAASFRLTEARATVSELVEAERELDALRSSERKDLSDREWYDRWRDAWIRKEAALAKFGGAS